MAEHFDGKGHHRKPRPYAPHNNLGLIKLARLAPLNALPLGSCDDELLETMVVEMGCSDSGKWYVDTSGCGILQANDANPPPRHGWLRKALQCAAVFLLGLMLLTWTTSCNKDPQPAPEPTPTDTITPVIPNDTIPPIISGDTIPDVPGGDTIVPNGGKIVKFYYNGGEIYPELDTIRRYANDPEYDSIYIKWGVPANYWTPNSFRVACDSLSKRFNISSKIYGGMTIRPYQILPDSDSTNIGVKGMIRSDSTQFANWGYGIYPQISKLGKTAKPPRYNGNRVLKVGRSH